MRRAVVVRFRQREQFRGAAAISGFDRADAHGERTPRDRRSEADEGSRGERALDTLKRLARVSELVFAEAAPPNSAQMIVRGSVIALPLEGTIDISAEKARLSKEIGKLEGEVKKIDAKLGNADFVARAPEEVVEENRERRADALSRIEKMKAALERLS